MRLRKHKTYTVNGYDALVEGGCLHQYKLTGPVRPWKREGNPSLRPKGVFITRIAEIEKAIEGW